VAQFVNLRRIRRGEDSGEASLSLFLSIFLVLEARMKEEEEEQRGLVAPGEKVKQSFSSCGSRETCLQGAAGVSICALLSLLLIAFLFHDDPAGHSGQLLLQRRSSKIEHSGASVKTLKDALSLDKREFAAISQVVLQALDNNDVRVRFTVEEPLHRRGRDTRCSDPGVTFQVHAWSENGGRRTVIEQVASHGACIASSGIGEFVWHYYWADLRDLAPSAKYIYEIGQRLTKDAGRLLNLEAEPPEGVLQFYFWSRPRIGDCTKVLAVGDTGPVERQTVLNEMKERIDEEQIPLLLHVGDAGYISNQGSCWDLKLQVQRKCQYDCRGDEECVGSHRVMEKNFEGWVNFFKDASVLLPFVPMVTTMGNHDNDVQWFHKFYPFVSSAEAKQKGLNPEVILMLQSLFNKQNGSVMQQKLVSQILKEPSFYSLSVGGVHLISIQSEDNAINAYERATSNDPLTMVEEDRFRRHFGSESFQLKWLVRDLAEIDQRKTPWIVVFTHRPFTSTSSHHPNCQSDGDWFKCAFRETYGPLFSKFGVDVVLSGHSHHYARTTPLKIAENEPSSLRKAPEDSHHPVYMIVGTGGFKLEAGFRFNPDWIAFRSETDYGFGVMSFDDSGSASTWNFHSCLQHRDIDSAKVTGKFSSK